MLRDQSNNNGFEEWNGTSAKSWREIDQELRALAKRRGAIDSEEAELLCHVVHLEIWRELGKASLLEYLEGVLGYGPRLAKERVRVALELDQLPALAEALKNGELSYSAIRELTRVATPRTEGEWRDFACGKSVREVEEQVAGHKRGNRPTDPANPDLRMKTVSFEVRPATLALLRQVQRVLEDERGMRFDDDAFVAALCNVALGGSDVRPKHQVMTVLCERCKQGWHQAAGRKIAIEHGATKRALCDPQHVHADGSVTQDVSAKTRRLVYRREGGKCVVPECRSARHNEIHHIVPRAHGGNHKADNLVLLCDGHHTALHDGKLTITGKAPDVIVTWTQTHVGQATNRDGEAIAALKSSGYKLFEARAAVETAKNHVGLDATLEQLLVEAFKWCGKTER